MGILKRLIETIFVNRLKNKLDKDTDLQQTLKDADKELKDMYLTVVDTLIQGREVPQYAMKYVNLNNLTDSENDNITTRIIHEVSNGNCPEESIVKISFFDSSHEMWPKYEKLLAQKKSERKKAAERLKRKQKKNVN
jgi:hypothetical protein